MSFETTKDYFRIAPNFRKSLVQEVLPEYFQEQYPSLISFLEGYYEFLGGRRSVFGDAYSCWEYWCGELLKQRKAKFDRHYENTNSY